jgi:hypothetical protein
MARTEEQREIGGKTYVILFNPDPTELVFPVESLITVIGITSSVPQGDAARFTANVFSQFNPGNSSLIERRKKHVEFRAKLLFERDPDRQKAWTTVVPRVMVDMLANGELAGSSAICQYLSVDGGTFGLCSFFRGLNRNAIIYTERPLSLISAPLVGVRKSPRESVSFHMRVDGVFDVKTRGIVVTGMVESGPVYVGDTVRLAGPRGTYTFMVKLIETLDQTLDHADPGQAVGLLLANLCSSDVEPGSLVDLA